MQDVSRLHTQGAGTVPEGAAGSERGTATPEGGLRALRALGEAEAPEGTALREKPGRNTGVESEASCRGLSYFDTRRAISGRLAGCQLSP